MKKFRAPFALVLLMLVVLLPARADARSRRPTAPHWIMTFDEEFNGPALDTTKWTPSRGPMDIQESPLQYFLPDELLLGNGSLRIRSEHKTVEGHGFTSGEITTLNKFAQTYGRVVVRCRYASLPGIWSAVYLLPASGAWPPEIDITEFIGREPDRIYITNHWRGANGRQQQNANDVDPKVDWTQWHTYEIVWLPGVVRWSIDGRVKARMYQGVSTVPMYLRVNTAIGGRFAGEAAETGWPKTFDVDYIRMYRRSDQPTPIFGITCPKSTPVILPPQAGAPGAVSGAEGAPSAWSVWDALLAAALLALWRFASVTRLNRPRTTMAFAVLVGAASAWYLCWRIPVVNWEFWWIALPLLGAELFGVAQILGFHYTVWPRPEPQLTPNASPLRRPIFILIPTVDEGRAVVEPTARGAMAARDAYRQAYPETEITIALCNDGYVAGRSDWSDMEDLAVDLGILCLTRREGGGAKAGNLEYARRSLGATGDALVAIFDADMAARPEFLLKTVPPFADPEIGWVQTGQYYRNLENPVARWAHDQQMVFFEAICPGKARLNAVFICGTNVVIRASALDEIGGLPQDSLTEDFAASVLLHSRWRSLYLPDILAAGLGPEDLGSYFTQQRRWAAGTLDVMRRERRRILGAARGGLSPAQRAQYALSGAHYLCGPSQIVFFLCPLLYLLAGVQPMVSVGPAEFFRHFAPFCVVTQIAQWYVCGRRWRWRGAILGFAAAPVLAAALVSVLLRRPGRFVVTPKGWRSGRDRRVLLPHFCGLAVSFIALIVTVCDGERGALGAVSVFWTLCNAVMLSSAVGLASAARAQAADAEAARRRLEKPALPGDWSLGEYIHRRRVREHDDSGETSPN